MSLEREHEYFEEHRTEWVKHHLGKFALIRGDELQGTFDTADSAYGAGIHAWGNVPFLIKQILTEDRVEQSPSLMYGLLHAHS